MKVFVFALLDHQNNVICVGKTGGNETFSQIASTNNKIAGMY